MTCECAGPSSVQALPHPGTVSIPRHSPQSVEPGGPPATLERPCWRSKMFPSRVVKHKSFCQYFLNNCLSQDRHFRNQKKPRLLPAPRPSDMASIHLFIHPTLSTNKEGPGALSRPLVYRACGPQFSTLSGPARSTAKTLLNIYNNYMAGSQTLGCRPPRHQSP